MPARVFQPWLEIRCCSTSKMWLNLAERETVINVHTRDCQEIIKAMRWMLKRPECTRERDKWDPDSHKALREFVKMCCSIVIFSGTVVNIWGIWAESVMFSSALAMDNMSLSHGFRSIISRDILFVFIMFSTDDGLRAVSLVCNGRVTDRVAASWSTRLHQYKACELSIWFLEDVGMMPEVKKSFTIFLWCFGMLEEIINPSSWVASCCRLGEGQTTIRKICGR